MLREEENLILTISIRPNSVIAIAQWDHGGGGEDKVVSIKLASDKQLKSLIQYEAKNSWEEKHSK